MMDQNTGRQDTNAVQPDQDAANYMEGTSGRSADVNRANSSRGSDFDPTAMTTSNAESATSAMDTLGRDGDFGTPYELDSSSSQPSSSDQTRSSDQMRSSEDTKVDTRGFRRKLELVKQKAQEMVHMRGEQIMDRVHHLKDDAKVRSERVDKTIRSNTYWFVLGSFGIGIILGRLFKGKMVSSGSERTMQPEVEVKNRKAV